MKLFAYSIFDMASGAYMRPFFLPQDAQALRTFTDIATDAEHEIGKHPEDYSLFRLGIFDDNKGTLEGHDRECIATALEVVAASRRVDEDAQRELLKVGGSA